MSRVPGLVLVALLSVLAACSNSQPASEPTAEAIAAETARLNEWFDVKHEELLQKSPIATTFLGRKDNYAAIDDMSEAAADEELAWRRGSVEQLRRDFKYDALTPEAKTSYDIWTYQLERREHAPFAAAAMSSRRCRGRRRRCRSSSSPCTRSTPRPT